MRRKISVIMGVYNAEKTLNRAIDSIIAQTYEDWLFIICDDASTDSSLSILMDYKHNYPDRFLILTNEHNKGLSYSLNKCLDYVDTEYVARMDADDISLPLRFQTEIDFLESNPDYSFVGTSIERFDENGVWKKSFAKNLPGYKQFLKSSGYVHPTVIIRSEAMIQAKGYCDKWYTKRCEDYDLWMRLYSLGLRGYNLDAILFQYYEGKESFPKRKFRYRICEFVTRVKGYYSIGVKGVDYIYCFKPLIAGVLPASIIKFIHSTYN